MDTQAKVEIVQRLYAAFARHDIPAIVAILSPEVEWVTRFQEFFDTYAAGEAFR